MKNSKLIFIATFIMAFLAAKAQVANEKDRLLLTKNFGLDVRSGKLSNGDLLKKYIEKSSYFTNDSVKQELDKYINGLRGAYVKFEEETFHAISYSKNEDKFKVLFDTKQERLEVGFQSIDGGVKPVDSNDLYVLEVGKDGQLFILFDHQNRILSFSGYRIGKRLGLFQL